MKFERVSKYPNAVLPVRATKDSAGYDFTIAEDTVCRPHKVTYVPTGIKAQIDYGYYLQLSLRSSAPKKFGVILANGVGIIDADYYNNEDNEGHIMFAVLPFGDEPVILKAGDRIGQGVFLRYRKTNDDVASDVVRSGGFGSTKDISYPSAETGKEFNMSETHFKLVSDQEEIR